MLAHRNIREDSYLFRQGAVGDAKAGSCTGLFNLPLSDLAAATRVRVRCGTWVVGRGGNGKGKRIVGALPGS